MNIQKTSQKVFTGQNPLYQVEKAIFQLHLHKSSFFSIFINLSKCSNSQTHKKSLLRCTLMYQKTPLNTITGMKFTFQLHLYNSSFFKAQVYKLRIHLESTRNGYIFEMQSKKLYQRFMGTTTHLKKPLHVHLLPLAVRKINILAPFIQIQFYEKCDKSQKLFPVICLY